MATKNTQPATMQAEHFPPLQGDDFVKVAGLMRLIDMGKQWFITQVALGEFPKFAKVDAYLLWRRAEIQAWITDRLAGDRFPENPTKQWANPHKGDDRLISVETVSDMTGVSVSSIWRKVRAEELPGYIKLGSRCLWSWGEVSHCAASRFEAARTDSQEPQP